MKVLFDFKDGSGGAPRSHLLHLNEVNKCGVDVGAVINRESALFTDLSENVRVFKVQGFQVRNLVGNVFAFFDYYKLIKEYNPDIVYSNRSPNTIFLAVLSDFLCFKLIVGQAGGRPLANDVNVIKDKPIIVYSKESYEDFIRYGISKQNIYYIPNRMTGIDDAICDKSERKEMNLLYVGNIKRQTYSGLNHLMDDTVKDALRYKQKVYLRIAGDLVGKETDKMLANLKNKIDKCNALLRGYGRIDWVGWVDNVCELQGNSDVCFGKGRSIIEPAMSGKVCYVVCESGKLVRVKKNILNVLEKYNYSGRGMNDIEDDSYMMFESLDILRMEAEECMTKISDTYHVKGSGDKLCEVFVKVDKEEKVELNVLQGLQRLSDIYRERIASKINLGNFYGKK